MWRKKREKWRPTTYLCKCQSPIFNTQNEKKQDAKLVALARTLTQLVFSIGTSTSKVMEEDMDKSKEEDNCKEENKEQAIMQGM